MSAMRGARYAATTLIRHMPPFSADTDYALLPARAMLLPRDDIATPCRLRACCHAIYATAPLYAAGAAHFAAYAAAMLP